ncbi:transposase [Kineococcus arenarius]|uniref:transposase n=1 Tax=unclassified Kineococcus TaxID=2621656 RepID=UPI003D7DC2B0
MITQVQQVRDLLECAWPDALSAAAQPFKSATWLATMTVILDRDGGDLAKTHRLGLARLEEQVRREIARWGGERPRLRIVRKLCAATTSTTGVIAHRRGARERIGFTLEDLHHAKTASARALVKHAGLEPREKLSGTFAGRTKVTGQGRPQLRLTAWRAIWPVSRSNPVYAARYQHLTTREHNRLAKTRAQAASAASLLRQLHAVVVSARPWDPIIATHGTRRRETRHVNDREVAQRAGDIGWRPHATLRD